MRRSVGILWSIAWASTMPYAQRAERAAAIRARWLAELQWSVVELDVLERAERLRSFGAAGAAADLVAQRVVIPSLVTNGELAMAVMLDLARWYAAYIGQPWDGSMVSLTRARSASTRRRRRLSDGTQPTTGGDEAQVRAYRASHLLVEPLDSHPSPLELRDYTLHVGWPVAFDCGRLEWDNPHGLACIFCDALLLPSEAIPAEGAPGVVRGRNCCKEG